MRDFTRAAKSAKSTHTWIHDFFSTHLALLAKRLLDLIDLLVSLLNVGHGRIDHVLRQEILIHWDFMKEVNVLSYVLDSRRVQRLVQIKELVG